MTRNYRRGFNRIYLVLTIGWMLFCVVWLPYDSQLEARKFSMNGAGIVYRSCREIADSFTLEQKERWEEKCQKQYDENLAKADQIPYFSYNGAFGWIIAFALLVPALLYGVLYAAFLLIRWMAFGFAKA